MDGWLRTRRFLYPALCLLSLTFDLFIRLPRLGDPAPRGGGKLGLKAVVAHRRC